MKTKRFICEGLKFYLMKVTLKLRDLVELITGVVQEEEIIRKYGLSRMQLWEIENALKQGRWRIKDGC